MILGIGTDLIRFSRIKKVFAQFPTSFPKKILHSEEYRKFEVLETEQQHRFLAKCFAAKEALLKALGTGKSQGIKWHDIIIGRHSSGKPYGKFEGQALKVLQNLLPAGTVADIHLTLTDEADFAQAFAVIAMFNKEIL